MSASVCGVSGSGLVLGLELGHVRVGDYNEA